MYEVDFDHCNFLSKEKPDLVSEERLCIHSILSKKYNYTPVRKQQEYRNFLFSAFMTLPVSKANLDYGGYTTRRMDWTSFWVTFHHMEFIAFQRRPKLTGNVLMKPFDLTTWLLFLSTAIALLILT